MFKWTELSTEISQGRYEVLRETLKRMGVENEVTFSQFSRDEEWLAALQEAERTMDGIRLGRGIGEAVLARTPDQSVHVSRLGSADCLIKENGRWWPRSANYEGLLRVLAKAGQHFELDSDALIVGAGAMARVAVAALFREGFKRFGLTALDQDRGRELIKNLERVYLGAQFRFVPKEELILLPGIYGVIVNTTPSTADNELLQELSYFNFFIPKGVAVDLYLRPAITDFLSEAKDIGATIVPGYEVAAATDAVWVKWALNKELPLTEYRESLREKFQSKV